MSTLASSPIVSPVVTAIAAVARLDPAVMPIICECPDVDGAVQKLGDARKRVDAIRLQAFALPIRDLAWWGVLATWHALGNQQPPAEKTALEALTRWVLQPSAEHRDQLQASVKNLGDVRPLRLFAQLVDLSGSDESNVDGRRAGVAGLFMASAERRHLTRDAFYVDLLAMGQTIAKTPQHWNRD